MGSVPHVAGVPSGEESVSTVLRKVPKMFPLSDPSIQLDLHHQRVATLIQEAADHQLARSVRHPRFHRWRRPSRRRAMVATT